MRHSFLWVFFILLVFSACQPTAENNNESTTPSGFKYTIYPSNSNIIGEVGQFVYYRASVSLNGEMQQDSRDAPSTPFMRITAPLPDSIPQPSPNILLEVIREMAQGDSAVVVVPVADAPFIRGLQPTDTIVYNIVSEEILGEEAFRERRRVESERLQAAIQVTRVKAQEVDSTMNLMLADYTAGKLDGELESTASGLKYMTIAKGEGKAIGENDFVSVHYYGKLTDGTTFDNSLDKGTPFTFPIGQGRVIRGWDEGIPLFNEGGEGYLFIPSTLGYGANASGSIPANSELVFYVSVEKVKVNTLNNRQAQ